jgi:hypothetical protein
MPNTRPVDDVVAVFKLKSEGRTDREVSGLTGVPLDTIRAWRNRRLPARAAAVLAGVETCPVCGCGVHNFRANRTRTCSVCT